jgi:hypothetical protein
MELANRRGAVTVYYRHRYDGYREKFLDFNGARLPPVTGRLWAQRAAARFTDIVVVIPSGKTICKSGSTTAKPVMGLILLAGLGIGTFAGPLTDPETEAEDAGQETLPLAWLGKRRPSDP